VSKAIVCSSVPLLHLGRRFQSRRLLHRRVAQAQRRHARHATENSGIQRMTSAMVLAE
jgi:hypothetical protein